MKRFMKKVTVFVAIFLILAGLTATKTQAGNGDVIVIAGEDIYETSVKAVASSTSQASTVIIASGASFADSLSAGNLVSHYHAPLLLVEKDRISQAALEELRALSPRRIILVGGVNTISQQIAESLKQIAEVTRISGTNRYETSKKVLQDLPPKPIGLATGENYPDALVAHSFLRNKGYLLLVHPSEKVKADYLFGGSSSLPYCEAKIHFAGKDRYETAMKIYQASSSQNTVFVSGTCFADALSALNLCQFKDAALLLVDPQTPDRRPAIQNGQTYLVGNIAAVSDGKMRQDPVPDFTLVPRKLDAFHPGESVYSKNLIDIKASSPAVLSELTLTPEKITVIGNADTKATITVSYKNISKSIDIVLPVKPLAQSHNYFPKKQEATARADLRKEAIRGTKAYLNIACGKSPVNDNALNFLADRLCRIQAEAGAYMPTTYWASIDGCRTFGFKRPSDPGHPLEYYALEMPALALDYGSVYGGYDLTGVTQYGVSIYIANQEIYTLVVIPEQQLGSHTSSPVVNHLTKGPWTDLGNGRQGAIASDEVLRLIQKGYNLCAQGDGRPVNAVKNSNTAAQQDALASAKRNAVQNRLEHEKVWRYYESLAICGCATEKGILSTGAILYVHGDILPYRKKDGIGAYVVKEPDGQYRIFVSVYAHD